MEENEDGVYQHTDIIGGGDGNFRTYPDTVIKDYMDMIKVKQRDENIDDILENREPKVNFISVSSRGLIDHRGDFKILNYDLINIDTPKLEYMNIPISISSRGIDE